MIILIHVYQNGKLGPFILVFFYIYALAQPSYSPPLRNVCLTTFIGGPVGGQKHHARMALLPPPPLVTYIGHTFLHLRLILIGQNRYSLLV